MKIFILFIILSLFSCATYNPNYMESNTTEERIVDVIILMGFGAVVGISVYEEIEKHM